MYNSSTLSVQTANPTVEYNQTEENYWNVNYPQFDYGRVRLDQNPTTTMNQFYGSSSYLQPKENFAPVMANTADVKLDSKLALNDSAVANESNKENLTGESLNNTNGLLPSCPTGVNNFPVFFTTQKIAPNTTKLSYTAFQLEVLNAIYSESKYPNSVQKTDIARLVGITRDQVKIWFQNRRRKDTLAAQGKLPQSIQQGLKRKSSCDDFDNTDGESNGYETGEQSTSMGGKKSIVDPDVIQSILNQLRAHKNAPSRLSSKRVKLNKGENSPTNDDENQKQAKRACINPMPSYDYSSTNVKTSPSNPVVEESNLRTPSSSASLPVSYTLPVSTSSSSSSSASNSSQSSSSSTNGCSTSGSSSNSSEDEINTQNYYNKQQQFQVLPQSVPIQDYVNNIYGLTSYNKYPIIHNQTTQAQQLHMNYPTATMYQPSQPANCTTMYNKPANDWSVYHQHQNHYYAKSIQNSEHFTPVYHQDETSTKPTINHMYPYDSTNSSQLTTYQHSLQMQQNYLNRQTQQHTAPTAYENYSNYLYTQ